MKNPARHIIPFIILCGGLTSCRTVAPPLDYRALARASVQLGVDIGMEDNHVLYVESATWMGVPYCPGGNGRQGVDCSGLTSRIYRDVYRKKLGRNTGEQMKQCAKISKGKLREGDLVFFTSRGSPRKVAHVGIYLKDGKFIHASTSNGVIVSSLHEPYYRTHWMSGGRR